MEEADQSNYAHTHPARGTLATRNTRYTVSASSPSSSTGYSDMQLRRRTNKQSLRESSDEEEGEEEVEEVEEEDAEPEEEEVEEEGDAEQDAGAEEDFAEPESEGEEEAQIDVEGDDEEMDDDASSMAHPRLKIKLKLPVVPSSTSNSATPVPEETRTRAAASTSRRSAAVRSRRRIQGAVRHGSTQVFLISLNPEDVESSDEDEDEEEVAAPTRSTRPMTTRQAVLANVVDPSHVSLDTDLAVDPNTMLTSDQKPNPRKKQLNETELALRREETARKRKNLSEKKLEDEKLETINRLLRKQSKPRAKKGAGTASGGVTPVSARGGKRGGARGGRGGRTGRSGLGTAKASAAGSEAGDEEGTNVDNEAEGNDEEGVEAEDEEGEEADHASGSGSGYVEDIPQIPLFRWISTSRPVEVQKEEAPTQMDVDDETKTKSDEPQGNQNMDVDVDKEKPGVTAASPDKPVDGTQSISSEPPRMTLSFSIPPAYLETPGLSQNPITPAPPRGTQTCAVAECSSPRKYRLVSDWTIGACGMGHLKVLETQSRASVV
ncbi:hypothetical protein V5O48_016456 [Marasmius crinis-equi]|uniref:INO80 complex subunit B-like conserved region domain-containing protein n=1 Tax=Marasmius crinis-equi TaxID=585013 RepID=A0ABR3ERQ8_9AGAR